MIKIITAGNVNTAFKDALWHLRTSGQIAQSRNGEVVLSPGPVITEYKRPWERILWEPKRDANPVFHLLEALWMFAGQNKGELLVPFNSRFAQYAEGDGRVHGAYGHRWREHFKYDQLETAVEMLRKDPNSRRVVIGMWDPNWDLGADKRDLPCNTQIYLQNLHGRLAMTVTCRSNDMFWGCYGANVVHFSMLQELLATELDLGIGSYIQFSNNFHLYTGVPAAAACLNMPPACEDEYYQQKVDIIPLIDPKAGETMQDMFDDCEGLWEITWPRLKTKFVREIAAPLHDIYLARRAGHEWVHLLNDVPDCDWKLAFKLWAKRREVNNGGE